MDNLIKKLPPRSWRTEEMHSRYESERQADIDSGGCPLCDAPTIEEFTHWRIIPNKYPYDAVTVRHEQIVPKRHTDGKDLSEEEILELEELKLNRLNKEFVFLFESLPKQKSIPGHYHLHLIVPKVIN